MTASDENQALGRRLIEIVNAGDLPALVVSGRIADAARR